MIQEDTLLNFGAKKVHYKKGEVILLEHERADFYYQIHSGEVTMFNLTEDGKEFIQGIFKKGKSFGEPPLFGDFPYPASARASKSSVLLRLPKKLLFDLLQSKPEVHLKLTKTLCNRLNYKAMILKEVSVYPPEHRILTLLHYLKKEAGTTEKYEVRLTRLQISELTGLRVETVIRAIKKLETEDKLTILRRKVYV